jgi:hypothetical protein
MARRKRKGGKKAQQMRFKKAAKACKGKKMRAFRACIRKKLKKR